MLSLNDHGTQDLTLLATGVVLLELSHVVYIIIYDDEQIGWLVVGGNILLGECQRHGWRRGDTTQMAGRING
jgi:hypothetical protein